MIPLAAQLHFEIPASACGGPTASICKPKERHWIAEHNGRILNRCYWAVASQLSMQSALPVWIRQATQSVTWSTTSGRTGLEMAHTQHYNIKSEAERAASAPGFGNVPCNEADESFEELPNFVERVVLKSRSGTAPWKLQTAP